MIGRCFLFAVLLGASLFVTSGLVAALSQVTIEAHIRVAHQPPAVGGVAELPALPATSTEEASAPAHDSGWSPGSYAALAGGMAALLAVIAGGWYARRRWLRD
jgi:hypothetical protein